MNLDQRKISIALVLVYIFCVIVSAYVLLTLQNELVYSAQVLNIDSLTDAQPTLLKLYMAVGITLAVGLGVLMFMFNNRSTEVIYVEKKKTDKKDTKDKKEEGEAKKSFDISSIKDALTTRSKSEEKILTDGLTEICKALEAGIGAFYMVKKDGNKNVLQMNATYAMSLGESERPTFEIGEGLVGQVAKELKPLIIDDIPEGYIKIVSGLGAASPTHIMLAPVQYGKELCGVVEIASFTAFDKKQLEAVEESFEIITEKLFAKDTPQPKAAKPEAKDKETKKRSKKA